MTRTPPTKLAEATRLTKAGRLVEAVAALRGKLTEVAAPPAIDKRLILNSLGQLTALPKVMVGHVLGDLAKTRPREGTTEHTFTSATGTRGYMLYVPLKRPPHPMPLVVMLHGCLQSPEDFARGTQMNALAEEFGFVVAYPRQPASANPAKCWNWFNEADQQREGGEAALIAGIATQVVQQNGIDPTRVYVAGLSAGGAAAATLGQQYGDIFAAVGVHSGLACGAAQTMSAAMAAMRTGAAGVSNRAKTLVPTIVFHGDSDTTVNPTNADHVLAQAAAERHLKQTRHEGRSAGGVAYTRTVAIDTKGVAVLEQWTVHGSGHAWSGGDARGSFTDPRGPEASREMVRFFLAHRRG